MTLNDLARLVKEMRLKQKQWFNPNTRTRDTLEESKALERQVDRAIEEVLGQPSLFDCVESEETSHD